MKFPCTSLYKKTAPNLVERFFISPARKIVIQEALQKTLSPVHCLRVAEEQIASGVHFAEAVRRRQMVLEETVAVELLLLTVARNFPLMMAGQIPPAQIGAY